MNFFNLLESTKSLEAKIRESFPGRIVKVWIESCDVYVGMINVWARADNARAYITIDPDYPPPNEWYLHDILYAEIKEAIGE